MFRYIYHVLYIKRRVAVIIALSVRRGVKATTAQAIRLSTARAFTFGGSGGIRSSNSLSTILRGSKEIRNGASPLG